MLSITDNITSSNLLFHACTLDCGTSQVKIKTYPQQNGLTTLDITTSNGYYPETTNFTLSMDNMEKLGIALLSMYNKAKNFDVSKFLPDLETPVNIKLKGVINENDYSYGEDGND